MKRILDKSFRYVPAASTDVRKTFERERKRLQKEREFNEHRVTSILKRRHG